MAPGKEVRSLVTACLLVISPLVSAQPIQVASDDSTTITLIGVVIGPIATGSKQDGTLFKSYLLALAKPMTFDDNEACGEQENSSLPINQFGMEKYKGKTIRVQAHIVCQLRNSGAYHLQDVVVQSR